MRLSGIKTTDEERSQSRARIAISALALVIFGSVSIFRDIDDRPALFPTLPVILGYLTFSVSWYVMVRRSANRYPWRRYISMVADLGATTLFLHLGGKYVAAFYPVYLWIIIGNGIRFGRKLLLSAVATGALGFGTVVLFGPYWRENMEVGLGLLAGVIVLPMFFLVVLHRLEAMQNLKIQLAESRLADKAKDKFLATMSHEIRTPMNGILGMAEVLEESDLQPQQRDQLNIITKSAESLLNIINDILDYSKITSCPLTLEEISFDLKRLLGDVTQLLKPTAESKGLDLVFNYPTDAHRRFLGDPTRVRQIVLNLASNAIKFTDAGQVRLSANIGEVSGRNNISLVIEDTGIGIPSSRLAAIFDQFEQADNSTTRQYGGTGLGLAISRKLSNLMGGDIVVASERRRGSVFTVTLSLPEDVAPAKEEDPKPVELPIFGLKALLAEDNKFNQAVVVNLLKRIGIEVDIAENGAEALQMLEKDYYDLVFMDIRMPVMNGYASARAIRARQDHLANIPILALTANTTRSDVEKCLEVGMDTHLAKPIRIAEVVKAIEALDFKSASVI